jgi:hypothetical protein
VFLRPQNRKNTLTQPLYNLIKVHLIEATAIEKNLLHKSTGAGLFKPFFFLAIEITQEGNG